MIKNYDKMPTYLVFGLGSITGGSKHLASEGNISTDFRLGGNIICFPAAHVNIDSLYWAKVYFQTGWRPWPDFYAGSATGWHASYTSIPPRFSVLTIGTTRTWQYRTLA